MKDGFIKIAAASPKTSVADVTANCREIIELIERADEAKANILLLPELAITSYTCGDLFFSERLLRSANEGLADIVKASRGKYPVVLVGCPVIYRSKLFNCAAVIANGKLLGIVPKTYLPNYNEYYEKRQFSSADMLPKNEKISLCGISDIPFGTDIVFSHSEISEYCFGAEICEDLWAPENPAAKAALSGATIILNLSASNEIIGKAEYRRDLVRSTSARLICGYVYASAGMGESTQDLVYSGHRLICENGRILADSGIFSNDDMTMSEIDVKLLSEERHKNTSFVLEKEPCRTVFFDQKIKETEITRFVNGRPFVPSDKDERDHRAETILNIQAYGLKKRLEHTHARTAVIGISGGLDSTLALLATIRAFGLAGKDKKDIIAVTMPCYGTTDRTKNNAVKLCELTGVTIREIPIGKAVKQHFEDIGHDESVHDVTYENSQARERTQILMDIANKESGMVIGTGDLSESALGWATYNGDHMSMYGINTSVPKTLVRYIISYEASSMEKELSDVLLDILDTPVSPELLPADDNGNISQKTEDIVGPYELHDFFLYNFVRFGFEPEKIRRLAYIAFDKSYDKDTIDKWLRTFMRRFFNQQFKRSCMPDSPKVGAVSLSPRGDWRMPSDASNALFTADL